MIRIFSLALLATTLFAQAQLEVIAAYYGSERHFFDVTDAVKNQAQADGLNLMVGADALGGDPMPGVMKTLRVYLKWNGQFQLSESKDGDTLRVGRAMRATPREPVRPAAPPLTVTRATYGAGDRTLDVTSLVQSRVRENTLEFEVGAVNLADPVPGTVKELVVTYTWQGQTREARARDGETLRLPNTAAPHHTLKLISATYGAGNRTSDVLGLLTLRLANDRLLVSADNNTLGGDPARGANKTLQVTYEWNGQRYTAAAKEGQMLRLPADNLAPVAQAAASGTPADGFCFYTSVNFQGASACFTQDQPRLGGRAASFRVFGRVKAVDFFESNSYGGRTIRLTGDQADLSQVSAGGGGFFGNSGQYGWVPVSGSFRLGQ
jgi:hypothetical protein